MRIPFAPNLRHGVDIVLSKRILDYTAPDGARLERLTRRFLHATEFVLLNKRFPWWQKPDIRRQPDLENLANFLAGRWAAKEAAQKAWGANLVSWKDLRIEYKEDTQSPCIICNPWPSNLKSSIEQEALLSISHDGAYTVASVIATPLEPVILAELRRKTDSVAIKRFSPVLDHSEKGSE